MKISGATPFARKLLLLCFAATLSALIACKNKPATPDSAPDLQVKVSSPFRFVAYGDTRFHNPQDTGAANPPVRVALVRAIADANPAFVCFTGDIVYNGDDADDWKTWDSETSIWREKGIPIFPALGNHDLHGDPNIALANYFHRFPDLQNRRYYSVRASNALVLILDSALDETSGPQGQWLTSELDHIPPKVDFVFIMLHHPPYTSSSDEKKYGGGHSSRSPEHMLAKMLEDRQANTRARFVVFSGHVHNYERHEHGGVTYFVSGGGGAHAYPIERAPEDPFQSKEINYHYLLVEVDQQELKVTMNRLQWSEGKSSWTKPDQVEIGLSKARSAAAGR